MCGNTFCAATPASAHNLFIAAQILERFIGLPLWVTNTFPVRISCSRQYAKRRVQSVFGSSTLRILPLQCTCASCRFNAENVIYSSSLTRIPVEQIVCRISARRIFPLRCAALTKRRYSSRVSSFSISQNIRRCCLSNRTLQSAAPIYDRKLFIATSIELILVAAYPFSIKYCLYRIASSFVKTFSSGRNS